MINGLENTDLSAAYINGCTADRGQLVISVQNAYILAAHPENNGKTDRKAEGFTVTAENFSLISVTMPERYFYALSGGSPKRIKARSLYKSEITGFMKRLSEETSDIISLCCGEELSLTIVFENGEIFEMRGRCTEIRTTFTALSDERPPIKLSLRERTAALIREMPVLLLSLGKKGTPVYAKFIAALAVGYYLSPLKIIPVPGYLDDLLILSGLVSLSLMLIPESVKSECKKEVLSGRGVFMPKKRWFYALPVVIVQLLLLMLIIGIVFKAVK